LNTTNNVKPCLTGLNIWNLWNITIFYILALKQVVVMICIVPRVMVSKKYIPPQYITRIHCYCTDNTFYLCIYFVINVVYVFLLSGSKSAILEIICLYLYWHWRGMRSHYRFNPATCLGYPKIGHRFPTPYVVISLCWMVSGERLLFDLLILVELLIMIISTCFLTIKKSNKL
jgi:hypothetical protein